MKKHFFFAALLVLSLAAVLMKWVERALYAFILPRLASLEGMYTDRLLALEFYIIAFIFALVVGLMLYAIVAFRRKSDEGEEAAGAYFHGHTMLEIIWTLVPLAVVLSIATIGTRYFFNIFRDRPGEMVVKVTGQMWSWVFEYPDYGITSTEAVLPVGRPVRFDITSRDVIHSFWVVEFRLKQDAVPGMVKSLWVTPVLEGEYTVRCAELCGAGHTYMYAPVKVVSEEAFQAWVQEKTQPTASGGETLDGRQVAQQAGCFACHTVDGSPGVGPSWAGLFGEEVVLDDGTKVQADEAYLYESIVDPNAKIVQGYPANVMPATYGEMLSEAEIQAIIDYIKSLGHSE